MKTAVVLLVLAAGACASTQPQKRAWISEIIRNRFTDIIRRIGNAYNEERDAVVGSVNTAGEALSPDQFDQMVDRLMDLIEPGMPIQACNRRCDGRARRIMGSFAHLAGELSGPLCRAALAKLEVTAG